MLAVYNFLGVIFYVLSYILAMMTMPFSVRYVRRRGAQCLNSFKLL